MPISARDKFKLGHYPKLLPLTVSHSRDVAFFFESLSRLFSESSETLLSSGDTFFE